MYDKLKPAMIAAVLIATGKCIVNGSIHSAKTAEEAKANDATVTKAIQDEGYTEEEAAFIFANVQVDIGVQMEIEGEVTQPADPLEAFLEALVPA